MNKIKGENISETTNPISSLHWYISGNLRKQTFCETIKKGRQVLVHTSNPSIKKPEEEFEVSLDYMFT